MELCPQSLNNLLPIRMCCQASSRRTTDTMLAVQLHVQRIKGMAARTDRNPDTVSIFGNVARRCVRRSLVFGFVELKADLREVVKLGDGASFDLCGDTTFEDTIEKGVDVRFFGKVEEGFGVVRGLHFFEILDDFLDNVSQAKEEYISIYLE